MKARRSIFEIYLDYVRHYGGSLRVSSLLQLTAELGFSSGAVRAALYRLCRQGWLQRTLGEKQSYYALTPMGRERVEEAAARIFGPRPDRWDGQWTILTYSLPENLRHHRDRLRRELLWLGFGLLSPATWITPNAVVEVTQRHLGQRKLESYVHLFRARHLNSLAHADLIEKCWNLDAVQARYRKFIRAWEPIWRRHQAAFNSGEPPPENVCFSSKMSLVHDYGRFLHIDPGLPSELLPEGWLGALAWRLFRECYLLLAERALNFFEGCFQGPPQLKSELQEARQKALQGLYEVA